MDEDIKIAEHLLEYLQLKIDDGVHKIQYNELLHDEKTIDCLNAIENLLSRLKTAERMNDVLADEVEDLHRYLVEEYGYFSVDYSKDTENTSKQEILEWARKKVEENV